MGLNYISDMGRVKGTFQRAKGSTEQLIETVLADSTVQPEKS